MNHPTYWRSVSLDDASHNAFTTFEARLGYGRGRPMIVRVAFTVDVEALSATILTAVAAHSLHIFDLTLNVPIDLADAVFSALRNDMSILRRLTIRLSSDSSELAVPDLPHDLIDKWASSGIRYLELSNIRIPPGPLPTLPTVISLNYDLPPAPHDEALGSMFPNLRTLVLGGEFVEEYHRSCIGFCSSVSFLQFGSSLTEVVSSLSLASVPHVAVLSPPAHIAQVLFNHLDGDLEAHLVDAGGSVFRVVVVSRLSSYARNFIEGTQDYGTMTHKWYINSQHAQHDRRLRLIGHKRIAQ
ncbi:hypothetical protein EXIGLDRAFT_843792 [Exidia glandulosa HHB12029]|uniref:F-box domain-containing protein n=1 Tax=Exidia glandulosa HHB12029 TaxID=1314781 RepID=A0A165ZG22_EXIGL|nr:hypothetical protein EXIGLDRAFT_843792 [Exidia glandulosa HHB12029]